MCKETLNRAVRERFARIGNVPGPRSEFFRGKSFSELSVKIHVRQCFGIVQFVHSSALSRSDSGCAPIDFTFSRTFVLSRRSNEISAWEPQTRYSPPPFFPFFRGGRSRLALLRGTELAGRILSRTSYAPSLSNLRNFRDLPDFPQNEHTRPIQRSKAEAR